jgi:transposase-like protein
MDQRIVVRYSMSFKRHVVEELESGRFSNISEVQKHYGIAGTATVRNWLVKYGRNHLCPKVVRVEKPNEKDKILQLKKQIKQLKEALGQTQAENSKKKPAPSCSPSQRTLASGRRTALQGGKYEPSELLQAPSPTS